MKHILEERDFSPIKLEVIIDTSQEYDELLKFLRNPKCAVYNAETLDSFKTLENLLTKTAQEILNE